MNTAFLRGFFWGGLSLFFPFRLFKNPRCDQQFSLLAPFISLWMGLENLMLSLSNTLYMWMIVFPHASLVCLIFMEKATCLIPLGVKGLRWFVPSKLDCQLTSAHHFHWKGDEVNSQRDISSSHSHLWPTAITK